MDKSDSNRCQARTERVDFSGNVSIYDNRHSAFAPERIVSQMLEMAGLPLGSRILDVGAGTGRVAIPFAREGYSVIAVDAEISLYSQRPTILTYSR